MADDDLPPHLREPNRQQSILPELPIEIPEQEHLPPRAEAEEKQQPERPPEPFLRRS